LFLAAAAATLSLPASLAAAQPAASNLSPVIGILSLPNELPAPLANASHSYFVASYAQWLQSAGARVVPILYDAPLEVNRALIKQINGAVLTGGGTAFFAADGVTLTPYARTAQLLLNESIAAAAAGEWWPVWGTCLGIELLSVLVAGPDNGVLGYFDAEDLQLALVPTPDAAGSRFWGTVIAESPESWTWLTTENITENLHVRGVATSFFKSNANLASTLTVLTTNLDRAGAEFVSSFEGKSAPVYGVQFHPEKPPYEFTPDYAIPHTYHAIVANGATQRFLVNEARRNSRAFASQAALLAAVIENTPLTFTAASSSSVIRKFNALFMFAQYSAPPAAGAAAAGGAQGAIAGIAVGVSIVLASAAVAGTLVRRRGGGGGGAEREDTESLLPKRARAAPSAASSLALALLVGAARSSLATAAGAAPRNLLFIVADDLRPELNLAYGASHMITPNADKFAKQATTFVRAYCNFAICSPSRNSFMTGRQPDHTRVWNFLQDFRHAGVGPTGLEGSRWKSLPEYFKTNGFLTLGHGKTYHPGKPAAWDEPQSWSQDQPYGPEWVTGCKGDQIRYCPTRDRAPNSYSDYNTTVQAIATLGKMVQQDKPWALFLGLHNPHQPWDIPAEVAWQYPGATAMAPPRFPFSTKGAPDVAFNAELDGGDHLAMDFGNPVLANRSHDPGLPSNASGLESYPCPSPGNNTVPEYFSQYMRLGYRTAVTATDTHLGMVLDALDQTGQTDSTLTVFLGDHGWQLGEHTEYGKHSNFDLAVHVPLMVRAPWIPASVGARSETAIELLDLYRTLASLVGLPPPDADVEGDDMSAALSEPAAMIKADAFAQYSRCPGERNFPDNMIAPEDWAINNCEDVPPQNITYMGYTLRTAPPSSGASEWRFTEWYRWNQETCEAQFDAPPIGTELYDHTGIPIVGDFDSAENENVAGANPQVVEELRAKLWARFRKTKHLGCPPPENATASLEWPHALGVGRRLRTIVER
jgi:arylsulfatase A-like enzyme/gamma-glutamyl-gamma-aminobutyrate hydrolase PuuD